MGEYPFDRLVRTLANAHLVRINIANVGARGIWGIGIQADINAVLGEILGLDVL